MMTFMVIALPARQVTAASFVDLDESLLARVRPDQIFLPRLSPAHDAIAVILRLEAMGYSGLITVVAPDLPDAGMVETGLRALGPGPRLALVTAFKP